ncbi:GntR family transcriptional regulator [Salibacterium qingdaonense]|uniref:GntR family transcriptional regulator, arabinose operon transcriptional repressor n=1 Tax=Salibacterium qingdaonense TaxID=266892 RepID=A0A1I4I1C6_9BACI|nr:GntR family transcriptional regulator [Salibacterium qingdaonense]SFL48238.1 GntR family transcriptional regulator, arabinose operon transcriptional repressor [Salibacterium qingdaonense]
MTPKYKNVKQFIKSKVLDGSYQPHQKIHSEYELVNYFDVSRHTIRQAIGELVSEGWLYREHGVGTFCADRSRFLQQPVRKSIAIITTYMSDYIFPHIIRGAESYLSDACYNVILFNTNNDLEKEKSALENILSQRVEGIIVEPTRSAFTNPNINYYLNLENQQIPFVMINAFYEELEPFHLVMNDEKGGYMQTRHLLDLGHEKIAGIFKNDDIQGTRRMKGFLKAHREAGTPVDPNQIITYSTAEKFGKPVEKIKQLLKEASQRPTAIVCYNDELVIQVLDVIREEKLSVPDDISIIGFDDSSLTETTEIKFASIKHPKTKMGEDAAALIVDRIEGASEDRAESIVYEPELVLRNSTAAPASGTSSIAT